MIIIDANILLYAADAASAQHKSARLWLDGALAGPEPVGLPWVSLLAFLRVGTNSRIRKDAFTLTEATAIVARWLDCPTVAVISPGPHHWEILRDLMEKAQVRGPLVTDAHWAALAIEYGAVLASTDRDFERFPGLNFVNPLASS